MQILDVHFELESGSVSFYGGRKTGKSGVKLSEQGENQQQAQPTCQPLDASARPKPCRGKNSLSLFNAFRVATSLSINVFDVAGFSAVTQLFWKIAVYSY